MAHGRAVSSIERLKEEVEELRKRLEVAMRQTQEKMQLEQPREVPTAVHSHLAVQIDDLRCRVDGVRDMIQDILQRLEL